MSRPSEILRRSRRATPTSRFEKVAWGCVYFAMIPIVLWATVQAHKLKGWLIEMGW